MNVRHQQQFANEGFLIVEDVLDPVVDFAPIVAELNAILDGIATELQARGEISSTYADLPFEARLIQVCAESGRNFPQAFDITLPQKDITHETPIYVGPALFRLLSNPRLLDLVEDLIGPEIYCNPVQHVRMKLPARAVNSGFQSTLVTRVPWHQHNGVIMPEADEATILTVWMPVNPATIDNGCLQVIPRSHVGDLETHCPGSPTVSIPDKLLPTERARPLPMQPGSLLLMTQRTIHSSLDNLTDDQVRISLDLRYQPIGQPTGRPAFAPGGFIARSRAHPEMVLSDPRVWAANWLRLRDALAEQANPVFNRWTADAPVCA